MALTKPALSQLLHPYKQFYSENARVTGTEIERWEKRETDKIQHSDGATPSGFLGNGMPLFQFLDISKTFEQGGTLVAESENCLAIIPAGFRKVGIPTFNTMNPVKYSIGGLSALMSLCHVLVVPKKTRIYNAVTLKKTHLRLLSEMEELGGIALKKLIEGTADLPGSIRWQLNERGTLQTAGSFRQVSFSLDPLDFAEECRDSFTGLSDGRFQAIQEESLRNMRFSFHMGDMASIGYLHMHCYLGNLRTTAHEVMEENAKKQGLRKNTPLDDVIYMINRIDCIQNDLGYIHDKDSWEKRSYSLKQIPE